MAKITLTDLTNLQNETTAVSKINLNNSLVETAIENTLSRDGSSPNMMGANLDMNSNRILNLPAPSVNTEPVRRYDLDVAIKGIVDFQNTLTEKVSEASDYATQAETSAVSAYSSYVLASAYADSLNAVSTTSNAIENGSKVFSIQTGKQFKNGQYVLISYTQDVTKYLYGYVTDYTGSSLTVQVVATQGSGTYADWTIGLSAIRGPQGEVGPKGDTGAQGPQGLQGPTGNTGPSAWAAPVAWQTGQSYTASAPASVVTQGGETYVCIISHTSGTFATDLAASKWLKIAAKGADGSGTGDMLKADNLSGLANIATARTNLGATTVGSALFTAADAAAARSTIGMTTIGSALSTAADAAAARGLLGVNSDTLQAALTRMALARALNVAQFGGMSFADSFGSQTYVDVAGATNLDVSSGVLKPSRQYSYEGPTGGGTVSSYSTGGYTLIDRGYTLDNGLTIVEVRLYSSVAQSVKFKVAQRNTAGNYSIVFSETFSHPGGGAADFVLTTPYTVPASGSYYPSTYSPGAIGTYSNGPRAYVSGDSSGTGTYTEDTEGTAMVRVKYDTGLFGNLIVTTSNIVVSSTPNQAIVSARIKHVVPATPGTDYSIYVSRDGGTTYSSAVTLTDYYVDPSDNAHVVSGTTNLSSQPSSTNVRLKFTTSTNKNVELLDWAVDCA